MSEREPRLAENIVNQWDDDRMVPAEPGAVIAWSEARDRLAGAQQYWLATVRTGGRPHVRPVLAVVVDGIVYSTTSPAARKAKNLVENSRAAISAVTDDIDFVIDATATPVSDAVTLERVAEAYRSKYGWPVTVRDDAFHAPFGAPTAGPPPYRPYAFTPDVVYGLGTNEKFAMRSTRWRF